MGSNKSKSNSKYIYKNKPHFLVLWFDKNNEHEENKKLKKYIEKNIFPPILRKYPGLEIIFEAHTNLSNYKEEMLTNKHLLHLLIITSFKLKKECDDCFSKHDRLEGIIVFCSISGMSLDAYSLCNKPIIHKIVDKKEEFYNEMNRIIHKFDQEIEKNIDLIEKLNNPSLNTNSINKEDKGDINKILEINDLNERNENIFYKHHDHLCDDDGYNFNIYTQLVKKNEVDPNLISNLVPYVNTLKIDFNPEENFDLFKSKIIQEFNDEENFSCNVEYLQKVYLDPIKEVQSIKELAKKFLYLYTTHYKSILFYDVINSSLRRFNKSKLKRLKHIICGLLLNFNQKYSQLHNYQHVHRFTNLNKTDNIMEGDILFSNQFLSTTLNTNINKNKFYLDRNTIFIIELNYYEKQNFFFNYIALNDNSRYLVEKEVLFCPFTKFEVLQKTTLSNGKTQIHLKQLLNNSLVKLIYDFTFNLSKSINYMEEDKKDIYKNNTLYFELYLKTLLKIKTGDHKEHMTQIANIYQTIGSLYFKMSEYSKSLENFESALRLRKQINNGLDISVSESYNSIGDVFVKQSKYKQAIENYTNSLINVIQLEGKDNLYVAICYNNLATVYKHLTEYQKSLYYYEGALVIFDKNNSNNIIFKATLLNNIANIYRIQCNFTRSLTNYKLAEKTIIQNLGENSIEASIIYSNIGYILKELSYFQEALEKLYKACEIIKNLIGEENQSLAICYDYIGGVYNSLGDTDKSKIYYEEALNITIKVFGESNDYTAHCYNNIGNIHLIKKNYNEAEVNFKKAKHIIKENNITSENNLNYLSVLNNIGNVYLAQDKNEEAMKIFNDTYRILKYFMKEETSTLATVNSLIASVYMNKKEYNLALDYFKKALRIREKIYDNTNICVSQTHNDIGDALLKTLSRDTSKEEDRNSKKTIDSVNSNNIIKSSFNQSGLISICNIFCVFSTGNYKDILENVEKHYMKALEITKKVFQKVDNAHYAKCYGNLAKLYKIKGEKHLSLSYYTQSLNILRKVYGNDKIEVGNCLLNMARFYDMLKMHYDSKELYKKGIDIIAKTKGGEIALQLYLKAFFSLEKNENYSYCIEILEEILKLEIVNCKNKKFRSFLDKKLTICYNKLNGK